MEPAHGFGKMNDRCTARNTRIKHLLDAGLVQAGTSSLLLPTHGSAHYADLNEDGSIVCQGMSPKRHEPTLWEADAGFQWVAHGWTRCIRCVHIMHHHVLHNPISA